MLFVMSKLEAEGGRDFQSSIKILNNCKMFHYIGIVNWKKNVNRGEWKALVVNIVQTGGTQRGGLSKLHQDCE